MDPLKLSDLIMPIVEECVNGVDWDGAPIYDKQAQIVGRYRNVYLLTIYDDCVRVRSAFHRLLAADPLFIDKLKEALAVSKVDIDTFEFGTHGKIPRQ